MELYPKSKRLFLLWLKKKLSNSSQININLCHKLLPFIMIAHKILLNEKWRDLIKMMYPRSTFHIQIFKFEIHNSIHGKWCALIKTSCLLFFSIDIKVSIWLVNSNIFWWNLHSMQYSCLGKKTKCASLSLNFNEKLRVYTDKKNQFFNIKVSLCSHSWNS